jgi:histidine triad (HIT) family protein
MDDCIFCKIAQSKIPARRLAEDKELLAFPDIEPQAPVHVLVIPKQHVPSLHDVKDWSLVGRMHALALRVARDQGIADSGFRVLINTGADGVQTVGHVHLHLLGGRTMQWPPG